MTQREDFISMKKINVLSTAMIAGLLSGSAAFATDAPAKDADAKTEKASCNSKSECKGAHKKSKDKDAAKLKDKSECKTATKVKDKSECKGANGCSGSCDTKAEKKK